MKSNRIAFALGMTVACAALSAATTTTWEMNSFQDFIRGRFTGVSLDRDGKLTLAPKLETIFSTGQPVIWSVAQAPDGAIYLGTGHRGRLYRVDKSGASSVVWTAEQPEVFAVAVDANGVLYAASSPDGKVYRIENGKASEFFAPKAKYIWALAFSRSGDLFVGAGEPGDVYRVDKSGQGELYYRTGQSHVTSLAFDPQDRVLAGSEPNGILYRIGERNKAFVLYNASLPEIRTIVSMPDGTIYAAALGGSLANRNNPILTGLSNAAGLPVAGPTMSVTVTDSETQAGPDLKPKADATKQNTPAAQQATSGTQLVEVAGVDKSAVYRINPDSTVDTLWTSKDENVYSLAVDSDGKILFSTDAQGRVYRLTPGRNEALVVQTNEGEATRLLQSSNGLLATTGDMGNLYRLGGGPSASGTYESPVHDAGTVARWGRLTWRQAQGAISFQTRSGNSARPDDTWSAWSNPLTDLANSSVKSPNARYIQWRAELTGAAATIENVSIAYLPQNNPPVIRSITASTQAVGQKTQASSSASAAYSITVTDNGETSGASLGTPTQALSRSAGSQIQIVWQADDPDADRLAYSLYFRGEDEKEWKLLRSNIYENSLLLDGDVLADGRYYFRVVASDRPSNAYNLAREAELVSSPVLIDNTPPVVTLSAPRRTDGHLELEVDAADKTSPLRRCEYSLDAGPWIPVEAVDGITDSPREQFHIAMDKLRPGEHLVVVRVYDTANNAGLAKVVVQ